MQKISFLDGDLKNDLSYYLQFEIDWTSSDLCQVSE